jgi:hypothetical protein
MTPSNAQSATPKAKARINVQARVLGAAALYFLLVFATGFALGFPRVLWLEPWLGKTLAVALEAPLLIAMMYFASRWAVRLAGVSGAPALLATGLIALALQQIADLSVGFGLRGMTLAEQIGYFSTPPGAIYALCLFLFALMPLLRGGAPVRQET